MRKVRTIELDFGYKIRVDYDREILFWVTTLYDREGRIVGDREYDRTDWAINRSIRMLTERANSLTAELVLA